MSQRCLRGWLCFTRPSPPSLRPPTAAPCLPSPTFRHLPSPPTAASSPPTAAIHHHPKEPRIDISGSHEFLGVSSSIANSSYPASSTASAFNFQIAFNFQSFSFHRYHMGKGAVLSLFLCISTHTHIVCAEKIEEDKAMVKDHRMAMEVNSEADETILGLDAHNGNEASSDDVAQIPNWNCPKCIACYNAQQTASPMDDIMCASCSCPNWNCPQCITCYNAQQTQSPMDDIMCASCDCYAYLPNRGGKGMGY